MALLPLAGHDRRAAGLRRGHGDPGDHLPAAEALRRPDPTFGRGHQLPAYGLPGRRSAALGSDGPGGAGRPPRGPGRTAGARRRRGVGRTDGGARAAAQPEPRRQGDRLPRRRRPKAWHARGRHHRPRDHRRGGGDPRRVQSRRGDHRHPLRSGHPARPGSHGLPRARCAGADAPDGIRVAPRRRPAHAAAARGPGRGCARARAGEDGARPGRRIRPGQGRDGHRRRRLDRLRAGPAGRPGPPKAAGPPRPRRGQPLPDRPGDDRGAAFHRGRVGARRLQGRRPDARGDAALQARRRVSMPPLTSTSR